MMIAEEFKTLYVCDDKEVTLHKKFRVLTGEWGHKYENFHTKEDIWFMDPQYFSVISYRSSKYSSGYEYGDVDVYEVEPIKVTTTEYRVKKINV